MHWGFNMKWENFQALRWEQLSQQPKPLDWIAIDVECPECNAMLYTLYGVTLTSNPPQHEYSCKKCGWHGYGY